MGCRRRSCERGDPYQWQIEQTGRAVRGGVGRRRVDWAICYQSRATPQNWIGPSTEAEIERAAHDKVAVLVVPIAFVSEHSETLVELDVEYRALAERLGVPGYFRVPTQNTDAGVHRGTGRSGATRARASVRACAAARRWTHLSAADREPLVPAMLHDDRVPCLRAIPGPRRSTSSR